MKVPTMAFGCTAIEDLIVNEDAYIQHNLSHLLPEDAIDAAVDDLVLASGILVLKNLAAVAGEAGPNIDVMTCTVERHWLDGKDMSS